MTEPCRGHSGPQARVLSSFLLSLVLLLAGCADDITLCAAPDSDFCEERLTEALAASSASAVSVAIVSNSRLVNQWSAGRLSRNDNRQVTASTPFRAGDITRTYTALGVLSYLQRYDINLDTTVNASLEDFRIPTQGQFDAHQVTLRHLLNDTSGLTPTRYAGYEFGEPLPSTLSLLHGDDFTKDPALRLNSAPGTHCLPSAAGYELAGHWLREQTGLPLLLWQNRRVFAPLNNTARYRLLGLPPPALGHNRAGRALDGGYRRTPNLASGGLWATPSDIAGLVMEIMAAERGVGRILYDRSLALAMLDPGQCGRGFGLDIQRLGNRTLISMDGVDAGFRSRFLADLGSGSAVVVMTNGDGALPLVNTLIQAVRREYNW